MKSDQIRSDQIVSGKGKERGIGFWVHYYFTLPLLLLYIYQRSEGKERKKSHKTMFVRVCVYVCVFRSSHIMNQGTYLGR